jgi:uncharacterized membrane protein YphA (DoxX/SURF4 family)
MSPLQSPSAAALDAPQVRYFGPSDLPVLSGPGASGRNVPVTTEAAPAAPRLSAGERRSAAILRFALGVIYLHFGYLKFYPDLSPAELLATQTVMIATGHQLNAQQSLFLIALLETLIGLGFLFGVCRRLVFGLFTFHMLGTFLPLVLLPEFAFKIFPLAPTLEGQYIIKNILFLAAGWTILLPDALHPQEKPSPTAKLGVSGQASGSSVEVRS